MAKITTSWLDNDSRYSGYSQMRQASQPTKPRDIGTNLNTDISTHISTHMDSVQTDVLIIGAGLAGLSVALNLPTRLQVTVLAKESLQVSSSYWAQGGIAGMVTGDDKLAYHVQDTLVAGAGLCNQANTQAILAQGNDCVDWLCQQGVPFTKNPTQSSDTHNSDAEDKDAHNKDSAGLHLTREGGHSHRRIVHADDATGKHIIDTLVEQVNNRTNITILTDHEALELTTQRITQQTTTKTEQLICNGALIKQPSNHPANQLLQIQASAVVLATGGLGQLYKNTTAPSISTGDGLMMAWQAGCRLANLEFVQFHPTGLANGLATGLTDKLATGKQSSTTKVLNSNFLLSEAIRGEGGLLRCPISNERFMLDIDERAELAPRDIVARAIYQQGINNGLGYVHLDISHREPAFIKQHFPKIYSYCLQQGIDITQSAIPVSPTVHYSCGGILTTAEGMTDIAALYGVGEVACTGLHGANRLASNSLLECVAVGKQIARHIATSEKHTSNIKNTQAMRKIQQQLVNTWRYPMAIDKDKDNSTDSSNALQVSEDSSQVLPQLANVDFTGYTQTQSVQAASMLIAIKKLMTDCMGIVRNQQTLEQGLQTLNQWQNKLAHSDQNSKSNKKTEHNRHITFEDYQLIKLIELSKLTIRSALLRVESRGGHYRDDYQRPMSSAKISLIQPCKTNEVNKTNNNRNSLCQQQTQIA